MNHRAVRWVTWGLVAACALLFLPLLPAVMLALWLHELAGPLNRALMRATRNRIRLAAALTVVALTLVLVPFIFAMTSLAAGAYDLILQLARSPRGKEVLEQLVTHQGPTHSSSSSLWDLALSQQERAWAIIQQIAGTASRVVIAVVVIVAGTYVLLIDGPRWYRWVEHHSPLPPDLLARFRDAFFETGRGLFIGIGGAGLLQAIVATIVYLALGIPHALELGLLTFCFSVIPAVGTALVWAPVAVGLALTDRSAAAITLAVCGVAVIGTIDNVARPFLTRRGHLQLPTYIVLVSMFAGVEMIGPWGLLVAPLAVRLARVALEVDDALPAPPAAPRSAT